MRPFLVNTGSSSEKHAPINIGVIVIEPTIVRNLFFMLPRTQEAPPKHVESIPAGMVKSPERNGSKIY